MPPPIPIVKVSWARAGVVHSAPITATAVTHPLHRLIATPPF